MPASHALQRTAARTLFAALGLGIGAWGAQVPALAQRYALNEAQLSMALLAAAKAECGPFMEEAARHMKLLEQTNLLEAPSPDPRITIQLPEPGKIQLVLRFLAPDRGRSRVEQAILRRYLVEMTQA